MNWYSIDAVDAAFKRTKKALTEPFDFWKWIKLGIIALFVGGGTGFPNFNSPSGQDMGFDEDKKVDVPSTEEIFNEISRFWHQYQTYILVALAVLVCIILLLGLISSIMEFVLVESLVKNNVTIRAYFRKYLVQGFNLFIIQTVLGILFLALFILAMLPLLQRFLEGGSSITPGTILGALLWFIAVFLVIAAVSGIVQSFISLSIPVAMYHGVGIITATKKILSRFGTEWKQIVVYWVVRVVLGLVAGIVVGIAALILFIVLFLIIILAGIILYISLSAFGVGTGNPLFWIVMALFVLIAFVPIMLFLLLASAPVPVFMKYHLLAFLQVWYPDATIPFFDAEITGT